MNIFEKIYGKIKRINSYNQTFKELDRLSDRELSDIGISRADIRSIALENAG